MDKFDRTIQRELLQYLCDIYPETADSHLMEEFAEKFGSIKTLSANILYLAGHGLLEARVSNELGYRSPQIIYALTKITSKGIDFIRNDGGLGAILNVQTIRFHRDTVVVLEDLIAISNMSDAEKDKAKSTLGDMPTEALKAVVQTITTAGLTALL
ncbi:hypothetical protein [Serratia grimesii]|uniref:hypothetical protein n=1 Tax=Serratia grimesii TaxID=82995 RepID=UPI00077C6A93|nr:hypothetical protein [Serratia grimesii]CAI0724444.1 Uncharacterised protein [Serratia grimesii]CAI2443994.1 Uncharacterised protein [Serratia grimesii]SUI32706.1 Uncharacterised protein [Serratia grimesii]